MMYEKIYYIRKRWRRRRYGRFYFQERMTRQDNISSFGSFLYATSSEESFIHEIEGRKDWAWKRTYSRYSKWRMEND